MAARPGSFGPHKMKVESDLQITMRDGVLLAYKVYRPEGEGEFPALLAVSPYQYETDDLPHSPLFLWREVGPVEWYVSHGYAYVHVDIRGTGKSEGTYRFLDETEQQDLYDLVEGVGALPWCNGKVGGIGQSYYAWSQWFMGVLNPPSLKCIAPYDGAVDIYRDAAYHGGIYCDFMNWWYTLVRNNNLHRAANATDGKAMDYDLGWDLSSRQTYDQWWQLRSVLERLPDIEVPVLSIGHWGKLGLHLRGNIMGYEEVGASKKLVVTGAKDVFEAHDMFDKIEFHEAELKPFYDHFLKGEDTGFWDGPEVRLFVRGREAYREEKEWPLKRAEFVPWHLHDGSSGSVTSLNDGGLATQAPAEDGGSTTYSYPDPKWTIGNVSFGPQGPDPIARVLTFTSDPLDDDVEVVGPIVLELYVSSTTTDTDFIVKLAEQLPQTEEARAKGLQPQSVNVTKGWLRASHREKDKARSKPYRPFYSHTNPTPIEPGKIYKYEIEVMPCAYLFKAGNRIRLEIANADSPITDSLFSHQYMWYKVGADTLHHDARHPSRLLLPIVPPKT